MPNHDVVIIAGVDEDKLVEEQNGGIFYEREDSSAGQDDQEDDIESSFKEIFPNTTPVKP